MPAMLAPPEGHWLVGWGQRLLPAADGQPVEPIHGRHPLDGVVPPTGRPYVAANLVASVDGRVALNGSAAGLGSPTDQRLMRRLRAEADALLHGAGTLRVDRFAPRVPADLAAARQRAGRPRQPLGVVVGGRGDLPAQHPYFTTATPDWPRVLHTLNPDLARLARPGIAVRYHQTAEVDLAGVLADLAARGVQRVMCEGGPTLLAALLRAGLVDELFLTVAPRLVGGAAPLTLVAGPLDAPAGLALRGLYRRGDELFSRYAVVGAAGAG